MADLYLANSLRRTLNTYLGTNLTVLDFGAFAARRRAEMAQHHHVDLREYLGVAVPGGPVDKAACKILAQYAGENAPTVTAAVEVATETARSVVEQAEGRDFSAAVWVVVMMLLSPFTTFGAWIAAAAAFCWRLGVALCWYGGWALLAFGVVYLVSQGVGFLTAFETVQRRVWVEDVEQAYGLNEAFWEAVRRMIWCAAWVVALPVRVGWWGFCAVRGSEAWKALWDRCARGVEAGREKVALAGRSLRYHSTTDWIWLQYYRVTNWVSRHVAKLAVASFGLLLLSKHLGTEGRDVVQFRSGLEMALHFGVPHEVFLPKKEYGSNCHYRRELWEGVAEMLSLGGDVVEERVTMGGSISVGRVEGVVAREAAGWGNGVLESVGVRQTVTETVEQARSSVESVPKTAVGGGWWGYCRQCRQRHCCEASDEEVAGSALFLED